MTAHIPVETLREWMASDDPLLHHLAFHTAFGHPETVDGLEEDERLDLLLHFLDEGLSGRYGESIPDGPYVLGHTVLGWLQQLTASDDPGARNALARVMQLLERLARQGDPATRDVLVLGILEHAFADDRTRALFEPWASDPELSALYDEARRLSA